MRGSMLVAACALFGACGDAAGYDYRTTCRVGQDERPDAAIKLVLAWPDLPTFDAPIALAHLNDGSGRLAVAERAGRIRFVAAGDAPDATPAVTTALDISDEVYGDGECGFIGLAVHPRYRDNGRVYTHHCVRRGDQTVSIIAEWTVAANAPDVIPRASERVLIELDQPWDNHNGGGLAFGPDGFLYIGFGDGGSGDDPLGSGQDTASLLGKILRVDVDVPVDQAGVSLPYAIPADNPFAGAPERGRPEVFAWGLRNPWRFSFDRATGELWVGDVGQDTTEEVNIVERGKNYGWNIMEGDECRPGGPDDCDLSGLEPPVVSYRHDVGRSLTGGYVYRGAAVPALVGRYVYADYATRVLFTWRRGEPAPGAPLLLVDGGIVSFGEDEAGELYAVDIDGGRVFRFAPGLSAATAEPPARLSETGCFDLEDAAGAAPDAALRPAPGVLGYDVALPFWSDGASKSRFVVLPDGGRIVPSEVGAFRFPIGTVLIKHFELKASGETAPQRIETRFLIQEALGVRGFTYRWDDAGGDATLATEGERFVVQGPLGVQDWHLPTRSDCGTCHRGLGVLGFEARQVGASVDQFAALGLLSGPPTAVAALPTPTSDASLEARARAWLHVNCAYCHDGGGPSGTALDLRVTTPLAATAACDEPPQRGDLGLTDARLIAPGEPERSLLWQRASVRDDHGMPPLASAVVDPDAALVRAWITSLASCR